MTTALKRHHSAAKPVGLSYGAQPGTDTDEIVPTFSMPRDVPQMSFSGVVDAILEVSKQRKSLLGQLRSALLSGNDSDALGFARQLCGLAA